MKTSNKILLSTLMLLLACIFAFGATLIYFTTNVPSHTEQGTNLSITEQMVHATNFKGVSTAGYWKVQIQKGPEYLVQINAPEELKDKIEVSEHKGILYLGLKDDYSFGYNAPPPEAIITLPSLEEIYTSGRSKITLQNLDSEALSISTSGSTHLDGDNNQFAKLVLQTSGNSTINLQKNPTHFIEAHLSGVTHLSLSLEDGVIVGDTSGLSSIQYDGNLVGQSITSSGKTNIQQTQ